MKGYHKITITVEIDEGEGVFTQTQEFSSGNPVFHASEFVKTSEGVTARLKKAVEAVYGVHPHERKLTP